MTFSLVARCRETGMFGVAISSSSPAVAARCSYARAGVGAVASQNVTDPTLGPMALDLMQDGLSAEDAVSEIRKRGAFIEYRQVLAVEQQYIRGPIALGYGHRAKDEMSLRVEICLRMMACPKQSLLTSNQARAIWGIVCLVRCARG